MTTATATNKVNWAKVANVTGVVIVAILKGAWWLTKHLAKAIVVVLIFLGSILGTVLSVMATTSHPNAKEDENPYRIKTTDQAYLDDDGFDHKTNRFKSYL